MEVYVTEVTPDHAEVRIVDDDGGRHICKVSDEGKVLEHGMDSYPVERDDRTDEEERTVQQVRQRARFAANDVGDFGFLSASWIPAELERGAEAVEDMDLAEFGAAFRPFYEALLDPEAIKEDLGISGEIFFVSQGFCVDDSDSVVEVEDDPYVAYVSGSGTIESVGGGLECPSGSTQLSTVLAYFEPADDFEYPDDFRPLVINNLVCQARDAYRHMGERPPDGLDIEGPGKPYTLADGLEGRRLKALKARDAR